MAEYLILIYQNETAAEEAGEAQLQVNLAGFGRFHDKHGDAVRGGNAVHPTYTATTIRPSNGRGRDLTLSDGPYEQTADALAGYYLIEAAHLDDAIAIASDIPMSFGGVEIRPIRVFS